MSTWVVLNQILISIWKALTAKWIESWILNPVNLAAKEKKKSHRNRIDKSVKIYYKKVTCSLVINLLGGWQDNVWLRLDLRLSGSGCINLSSRSEFTFDWPLNGFACISCTHQSILNCRTSFYLSIYFYKHVTRKLLRHTPKKKLHQLLIR